MSSVKIVSKKYKKRYKCPYCEERLDREKLPDHIQKKHEDMIPQGYTASRVAFNTINKKSVGHCIICGKDTDWNEDKCRYERICNDPKCKKEYIKMTEERLKKARGVTKKEMLSDPEFQNKMLKGRSISGTYKFSDGGKLEYVGSYEKNFLEFMDKFLKVKSSDIQAPGPTIEYYFEGKKHFWITDYYYIPYNLVLDIKDGGKNPNNREMASYRAKQVAKEKAIVQSGMYNYIRLTDNQFDQLIEIMLDLKESLIELEGSYNQKMAQIKPVVKINEQSILEAVKKVKEKNIPVHEVFISDGIHRVLQRVLTDPNTYKNKDISELEDYIHSITNEYSLLDAYTYIQATLQEHSERWVNYYRVLEGGKSTYDFQLDCEAFKAAGVILEEMNWVGDKLRDLKKHVINKIREKKIFAESVSGLTPEYLNRFYTILKARLSEDDDVDDFDMKYMMESVI